MNKTYLDIDAWNRRDHFHFFRGFSEPFYGIVVDIDCTLAHKFAKENGHSFYLYYLYNSLKAVNTVEPFKYRIEGDKVVIYERIDPAPTVGREDGTFGFSYFPFHPDFEVFCKEARKVTDKVKAESTLKPGDEQHVIYYSALPWLKFTSISHARDLERPDSVPKISFGKLYDDGDKKMMPMSVHVHHALLDGYHVSQYVDLFQKFMNGEES
ncbi:chloramphenicol acetyltransferase [Fulvivirga sp. RKSG066]|uniref:chloramphenicol acetyltransferase n=1 Tax=Fulvivirga aurantia TaxID=2529383 RepID=UPI0012BB6C22|nr:chloramphenicol acetyltransferase [Fulvivirga aurantia]MTI21949.1 chloramphenicol acetyltransferase [Fulvivirga aurantia]